VSVTRTKVIAWKPFCLQMKNNDDDISITLYHRNTFAVVYLVKI